MKNKRGITLVSLVVTIIILIILAGVSINLTLGDNGLITMAKKARENMELAKVDEERQLNELYEQIKEEGGNVGQTGNDTNNTELIEFKQKIASAITDMGIETLETANADTMASNIKSILGETSAEKVSYNNTNSELTSNNVQGAIDEINNDVQKINENKQLWVPTGAGWSVAVEGRNWYKIVGNMIIINFSLIYNGNMEAWTTKTVVTDFKESFGVTPSYACTVGGIQDLGTVSYISILNNDIVIQNHSSSTANNKEFVGQLIAVFE